MLLSTGSGGEILGYGVIGWISTALTVFGVFWISRVGRPVATKFEPAIAVE
jgi:hypothetical protein